MPEGTTNDPFPQPIPREEGAITVTLREFATLPDIDGVAARMMTLVEEPSSHRLFVSDMRGQLYTVSPDGKYVVDTFSQPDVAPETTLRDAMTGALIMPLEKADISKLLATGWKPPMQIKMMAADGKTEIYGMLFRPTNFDPSKKYPIINQAYPGPQSGSVGSRAFTAARGDRQALAELGFVVVSIDGTGTPNRSKAFTDAY